MKNKILFISSLLFTMLIACNSNKKQDNSNTNNDSANNIAEIVENNSDNNENLGNNSLLNTDAKQENNTLLIKGQDIWIRETPSTGKVIMKLADQTKCSVLEKDKLETINGTTDYWYKIEHDGKKGYVFGSQTSLKIDQANINSQIQNFEEVYDIIVNSCKENSYDKINEEYIHPDFGIIYISNPGAFHDINFDKSIKEFGTLHSFQKDFNAVVENNLPEYSDCEWENNNKTYISDIKEFPFDLSEKMKTLEKFLEIKYTKQQYNKAQILSRKCSKAIYFTNAVVRIFCFNENGKWYIGIVDISDCSA